MCSAIRADKSACKFFLDEASQGMHMFEVSITPYHSLRNLLSDSRTMVHTAVPQRQRGPCSSTSGLCPAMTVRTQPMVANTSHQFYNNLPVFLERVE